MDAFPDAPLVVTVPILLLAAVVAAWVLHDEGNPMSTADNRPNPLGEAASKIGVAWSAAAGVIGALVSFGVLTAAQGEAITAAGAATQDTTTALGTVIGGVIPLIGAVVASFRTSAGARPHVTPVEDPRDQQNRALAPVIVGEHRRVVDEG